LLFFFLYFSTFCGSGEWSYPFTSLASPRANMPKSKRGKRVAPLPAAAKGGKIEKKKTTKSDTSPYAALFIPRPKNFTIGNDIQPKRDLSRMVKYPAYIQRQRKKKYFCSA